MKKLILAAAAVCLSLAAMGQAKKPSIMVVPSDLWCNQNGFMTTYDNQGVATYIPDYRKALMDNPQLLPVISQLNGLMADRGFPLKNLESVLKSIDNSSAEMAAVSASDGSGVQSNPLMQLRNRARADIIMQLTWSINTMGPKQSVTYTLQGLDSYTDKEVATSTGTGAPSFTAELPVLLSEAVNAHIDEFCDRLQSHFEDLLENGREISLDINVFDNDEGINLETEFGDKELKEIIEDWVNDNTVNHRYNLADDTELNMKFESVRIPIYDEKGRAMAANHFGRSLVKYLKGEPCNIPLIKQLNAGLGKSIIIIGNK